MQAGRVLARHDHRGRHHGEAERRVVAGIADEQDEVEVRLGRQPQALAHQRAAYAAAAQGGLDGERSEQQGGLGAEQQPPIADRAQEPAIVPRHQRQTRLRLAADAVAIGELALPPRAERTVQEILDGRRIERRFGSEVEHGSAQQ